MIFFLAGENLPFLKMGHAGLVPPLRQGCKGIQGVWDPAFWTLSQKALKHSTSLVSWREHQDMLRWRYKCTIMMICLFVLSLQATVIPFHVYYTHIFDIPRLKGGTFGVTANVTSRVFCCLYISNTPTAACRECHSLQGISGHTNRYSRAVTIHISPYAKERVGRPKMSLSGWH